MTLTDTISHISSAGATDSTEGCECATDEALRTSGASTYRTAHTCFCFASFAVGGDVCLLCRQ